MCLAFDGLTIGGRLALFLFWRVWLSVGFRWADDWLSLGVGSFIGEGFLIDFQLVDNRLSFGVGSLIGEGFL